MNNIIIAKNISEYNIFDNRITYYYYGWKITDNGNYLYNNGNIEQPFLVYDTKMKNMIKLSYPKKLNTDIQYILFTSKNIIYNNYDKIIIEDYNNNIIKIINNYNANIIKLIKNEKYLFASDNDNTIKVYNLDTFEMVFSSYFYRFGCMNVSCDNKYLITGWNNINIYDLEENKLSITFKINNDIDHLAINKHHIAILYNNTIMIYNLYGCYLQSNIINIQYDKYEEYEFLNYSYDDKYLYYGNSYELIIFTTNNYNIIKKYNLNNVTSYYLTNDDYKILYINNKILGTIYTLQFYQFIHDLIIDYLPEELVDNIWVILSSNQNSTLSD